MSDVTDKLIREIDAYLGRNPGIAESTLARMSVNDGKAISRLRAGGRCWPETAERIRNFMSSHRYPTTRRRETAA